MFSFMYFFFEQKTFEIFCLILSSPQSITWCQKVSKVLLFCLQKRNFPENLKKLTYANTIKTDLKMPSGIRITLQVDRETF